MRKKKTSQRRRRRRATVNRRTVQDGRGPVAPVETASEARNDGHQERPAPECTIVGVGASAGGLEAFSQLLQALPRDPGFAMVLVQHLAPQHQSALPTLLSGRTSMRVVQATEGLQVEPNQVYVIPPNVRMGIRDSHLHLMPRPSDRTQYTPIDYFMRTLADSAQHRGIAVILSGTASDGTLGVREVKAVGGVTIAQEPESARYDGMPRAAIATGLVDLILPPAEIARELVRISRHPLERVVRAAVPVKSEGEVAPPTDQHLEQIFQALRIATGVDFRRYKRPTIERRLHRRIVLHKLPNTEQYLRFLKETPSEVEALYQDILIHVTRFFREPESFAEIATGVLPKIMESRGEEEPIRIWIPGCSTGEEAYSVAIVVLEYFGQHPTVPLQVFATDVSELAIEHARGGQYPEAIAADVSPERLRRFFSRVDGGYRINKSVRDHCVFARQDLTRDPPFSKLDLIVCRNVLIYMATELQAKLMSVFHYALRPRGFLMLGAAETIGVRSDLFAATDKKHRIYSRKPTNGQEMQLPVEPSPAVRPLPPRDRPALRDDVKSVTGEANRLVEERYAPAGVIVDGNLHVVQFRGQTGAFLEPAPGDPSMNVLKMAREGLLHGLRAALTEARRKRVPARKRRLRVRADRSWRTVDLEVFPLSDNEQPHYLILFEEEAQRTAPKRGGREQEQEQEQERRAPGRGRPQVIVRLEEELASSRQYLQSIIQELEAANEELQSANEEVLSANEELQSTNEELDTAKEELQSTNEELNTVNEELQGRNEELSRLNGDLTNLLGSVQIAILIVSADLRIRRFTPMAERLLNLLPGDVGRPIGHIKPNIECADLEQQIAQVIDSVTVVEREVQDRQGRWLSMRIRPYKSLDNRIDGAVIALFDIDEARQKDEAARRARDFADAIVETVRQPLAVLDKALRIERINAAFADVFGVSPSEAKGRPIDELGDGEWRGPRLRQQLEDVLGNRPRLDNFEFRHPLASGGEKKLLLHARRIAAGGEREAMILIALEERDEARRTGVPVPEGVK